MINELRLKRDALLKTIDKEKIARDVINALPNYKVMFIYLGGSICYGTFFPNKSDRDINVFVDGFSGALKVELYGSDAFIYGKDVYTERLNPSNRFSSYKKCFMDDYLSLPDTLIYLNKDYQKEYEAYANFKMNNEILHGFLSNFIDYFGFCFSGSSVLTKKLYHIIRMKGQIEKYRETAVFSLEIDKKYYDEEIDYKTNFGDKSRQDYFFNLLETYLNDIIKFKEGLKDG